MFLVQDLSNDLSHGMPLGLKIRHFLGVKIIVFEDYFSSKEKYFFCL